MSKLTVDTEALEKAAAALTKYIESVSNNIQKMKDAATDCGDNMGSDAYSNKAISNLEACVKELSKTLNEAVELRKKILDKKKQIEDSLRGF